ncbi:MAG: prepilin-type N-terminal cleavage/methylation domain-containing protein [Planctomycetaceae bacterium]|nr:prepilin-type N-terminal cleavage/methylation domain-containing protein [Planctomycetales bacterium]MCB9937611.1 prepilin-type N-terminal cleavage/methylation domain-containing protein [Planctomycetaceae bacterium]
MTAKAATFRLTAKQRGFTLAELVIAVATSSLLVAGMTSAIFLAVRSADTNSGTALAIQGSMVLEDIAAELRDAVYFKQRTATSVMFTVPDRDGDGDVETIRYSWTGTAGASLLREYNGGSAIPTVDDVHGFQLAYTIDTNATANKILFVVPNESSLDADDSAKQTSFQSWGYSVQPVTAARTNAQIDALAAAADAIYISENIVASDLNTKLNDAKAGIVNEVGALHDDLELASSAGVSYTGTQIRIADNTHYVTSPFNIGVLSITATAQYLGRMNGTLATDLQTIAQDFGGTNSSLTVIGTGGRLEDGTPALGPRLNWPIGNDFSFSALNSAGLTLLQRAVDWAARKYTVTSVGITLQVGSDGSSAVQTATEIRSKPRA